MFNINAKAVFILGLAEKGFVVLSLLFFTEAIIPIMKEAKWLPLNQINTINQVFFLSILAVNLLLIVVWHKSVTRIVIKEKLLWALVAIALVSVLWSYAPGVTLHRIRVLVNSTLFGVYFAARYSLKEQLRLLAWAFGIAALLSLVSILALPSYGVMGMGSTVNPEHLAHMGAWRGIYSHKNIMGRTMVLSGLVFFLLARSSRRYRWGAWAGCGLSASLVLGSSSKSALVVLLVITAIAPIYRALRWSYTLALPLFIAVILVSGGVAMFLVVNAETILGAMGGDLSLSGRTELWAALLDKIWERPWLGYGYGGFWLDSSGKSVEVWNMIGGWKAPNGHNGFLDLWLDLGLLGLSVFIFSFIVVYFQATTWVSQAKTAEGFFPLAYLTFLLLINLTQSVLLIPSSSFFWLLYVTVTLSMYRSNSPSTQTLTHLFTSFTIKIKQFANRS